MIALADVKIRLNGLVEQANELEKTKYTGAKPFNTEMVNDEDYRLVRAASLSFIVSVFGKEHTYYTELERLMHGNYLYCTKAGRGILKAAKQEIDGGWIFKTKDIVSGEIFTDFLEMATYLLDNNYHQPAAVIVGSVLEQHLRHLCVKNGIATTTVGKDGKTVPNKAETMNTDLTKHAVYGKTDQKNVTAWLGIRNHAAHGEHTLYTKEQVELMEQGISNFLVRVT